MTLRRTLPAALGAIMLSMLAPAPAAACLTAYMPAEHFKRTDLVLTGVAVDRHAGNAFDAVLMLLGSYQAPVDVAYEIAVDGIEKGENTVRDRERVTLHLDGFSSCAQELELGQRYRIGAMDGMGGLTVPFGAIEKLPLLPGEQPALAISGSAARVTFVDLLPIPLVLAMLVMVVVGLRLAWGGLRARLSRGVGA